MTLPRTSVLVRYGDKQQSLQLLSQSSYLSSNDPRLYFGLGAATKAKIEIFWPVTNTKPSKI
jgi:hypothetical protein